jgi:hypothetical protein
MMRVTAPSMIDEAKVKVVSGLRPKPKAGSKSVAPQSAATTLTLHKGAAKAQLYANPLDRLCELLLDWRILEDVRKGRERERDSTSARKDNVKLPNCYATHQQYLTSWEPLLIQEIKAGILSNLPLSTKRSSKCGTAMISAQDSSQTSSTVINLNCVFSKNAMETETTSSKQADRYVKCSLESSIFSSKQYTIVHLSVIFLSIYLVQQMA